MTEPTPCPHDPPCIELLDVEVGETGRTPEMALFLLFCEERRLSKGLQDQWGKCADKAHALARAHIKLEAEIQRLQRALRNIPGHMVTRFVPIVDVEGNMVDTSYTFVVTQPGMFVEIGAFVESVLAGEPLPEDWE